MNSVTTLSGEKFTIKDIENLSEKTVQSFSDDCVEIKGHNVYFVDFDGYFGYSALVFCNEHQIHYANEYELHHTWRNATHEALRDIYIENLTNKLFTEEELSEPLRSYDDYERRHYFLQNYYGMRETYVSAFVIAPTEKEEKAFKRKVENLHYNPVCYAYYESEEFVKHCVQLHVNLMKVKKDTLDNFDYWKDAILTEMFNHEYGINWQADYDVLSAFGNPEWRRGDKNTLEAWFKDVGFNAKQKKAYAAAKEEYYKICTEKGIL